MLVSADPPARSLALIGETYAAVRAVMVEGPSGILAISPTHERPQFFPSRQLLVWPNGAQARLFASTAPEALRGPQFDAAWCDELAKWKYADATWDMLQFGLRLGLHPQQMITTTPRSVPLLRSLIDDPQCKVTRSTSQANAANLAPSFLRDIVGRYAGTRLGRQELDGELLPDQAQGYWTTDLLERQRCTARPVLARVIVSLDPAVSAGARANACGIIVLGQAASGEAYVLADETRQGLTPLNWAHHVGAVYAQYGASLLVAEVNQGGALVRDIILREFPHIEFMAVRAGVNKAQRAEPIAALYERGMVFHYGRFDALEDEMIRYCGSGASPDRLDALVWGLGELLLKPHAIAPQIRSL